MKKIAIVLLFLLITGCTKKEVYTKAEVDEMIKDTLEKVSESLNDNRLSELSESVVNVVKDVIDSVYVVGTLDRENNLTSTGSGAIFHEDDEYYYGFSNSHVVENGSDYIVKFENGKVFNAELHAFSNETDLAVIKIKKSDIDYELNILTIVDYENVNVGEFVVAIGTPLNVSYLNSVTFGIVSSVDRRVMVSDTDNDGINDSSMLMIQHDAAINSGNSGGPLLNLNGEVVGVNTLKISSEGTQGIGLAISSNYLQKVLFDLVEYKEYVKPKIGVYLNSLLIDTEVEGYKGILISEVIEDGPAYKAKMQKEDIIVMFNGQVFTSFDELKDFLNFSRVGDSIKFTVVRDNKLKEIEVILE